MAFNFTAFLTDIGTGLGNFLSAIQEPLVYFVLVLGIGGAVASLIYSIMSLIKSKSK